MKKFPFLKFWYFDFIIMAEAKFEINKEFIPFHFDRATLFKIGKEDVFNQIIGVNHYYKIKSDVRTETFNNFLIYLKGGPMPTIEESNYLEYMQLSNEFDFMKDKLESDEFRHFLNLSNLINLVINTKENRPTIERLISLQLDECITNLPNELQNIEINTLFNIFNHPDRVLNDHDKAYRFIIHLGETKDQNYYALLNLLDASKFNEEENLRDSFLKRKERFGLCPVNIEHIITTFDQKIADFEQSIHSLEQRNNELEQNYQSLEQQKNELEQNYQSLEQRNHELEQNIHNLEQQKHDLEQNNHRLQSNLTEKENEIREKTQQNEQSTNKINIIEQKVSSIKQRAHGIVYQKEFQIFRQLQNAPTNGDTYSNMTYIGQLNQQLRQIGVITANGNDMNSFHQASAQYKQFQKRQIDQLIQIVIDLSNLS